MVTQRSRAGCAVALAALFSGCVGSARGGVPQWPDLPFDPGRRADGEPVGAGDAATRADQQDAVQALERLRERPTDEDRIIWYGRRLAYLGYYEEAIEVYGLGLTIHAESPRLLRHRGHRFLSLRQYGAAVGDLMRAARAIEGTEDVVEPDGKPNARGIPTSTLHTNVWYHLGLARYCRAEFQEARYCYEQCLAAAKNPDMEVATRYWLYLTAARLGELEVAAQVLKPVDVGWDVIENHAYHRLLLLYRGERQFSDFRTDLADDVQNLSLGYGLARYHYLRGDDAAGKRALERVAAARSPAFGCIAAEADLAHLAGSGERP